MAKTSALKEPPLAPNAFIGKPAPPSEQELASALGRSMVLWRKVVAELAELGAATAEWNSYSKKAGWSLRLRKGERNIVYLSPCVNSFRASFALGEKAIQQAIAGGLPERVVQAIRNAKRYAEGTAVRIEVNSATEVAVVKKLAIAKIAN